MTKGLWAPVSIAVCLSVSGCKGGTTVGLIPCTSKANCSATQYCADGSCYPKVLTGTCGDGADHTSNDVCTSGVCLGGACCASACATSDPTCKAASCEATSGACQYPSSTVACGPPESCTTGSHTAASSCDGKGGCALEQPTPCDAGACADNRTCIVSCIDGSACGATGYCASGECLPKLAAGATCGPTSTSPADFACSSGACLGTHCCSAPCDTIDTQCGATSCDTSGACFYPGQQIKCGALQGCLGATYTPQSACNGQGTCVLSPPQACEPYVCDEPGNICFASCTPDGGQCAPDSYCGSQACLLKEGPGQACTATSTSAANAACKSGICAGTCCVANCVIDTVYNCSPLCDDHGACLPAVCPGNFGCGATSVCETQCATNADCSTAAFCDLTGVSACCAKYHSGDTLYVDGVAGNDLAFCCGSKTTPCQTLSHAMKLVDASGITGVILQASNGDGSSSWTANEVYPIHLGWGITLNAPHMYFANQQKQVTDIFQVYAYDATDLGTVTIQGGTSGIALDGVFIGFDLALGRYKYTENAVNAGLASPAPVSLVLSEVWLNANDISGKGVALNVGAGSTVTLGPNPVEIGGGALIGSVNYVLGGSPDSYLYSGTGIYCTGAGAIVQDDATATKTVLTMDSILRRYLRAADGCLVNLTQSPTFGYLQNTPETWDGTDVGCCGSVGCSGYCYSSCVTPFPGAAAVGVFGSANVTFGSATMPGLIRCAALYGFEQETSDATGSPTVTLNGATIDLNQGITYEDGVLHEAGGMACAGAMITEGSFSASNTTFTHAYLGVFIGSNVVSADLSGGGSGGNTFACNGSAWGSSPNCVSNPSDVPPNNGADVVNTTASIGVSAQNATWDNWDSTDNSTQVWSCSDLSYSDCTCTGPQCSSYTSPGTPPDDADAIYLSTSTAATPIDSTLGSQSSSGCP